MSKHVETPGFESADVWRRISPTKLVRYRCFRNISTGRYSVQSADFYNWPLEPEQQANLERQYITLFAEQNPEERAGAYPSLSEAIQAHDAEFRS